MKTSAEAGTKWRSASKTPSSQSVPNHICPNFSASSNWSTPPLCRPSKYPYSTPGSGAYPYSPSSFSTEPLKGSRAHDGGADKENVLTSGMSYSSTPQSIRFTSPPRMAHRESHPDAHPKGYTESNANPLRGYSKSPHYGDEIKFPHYQSSSTYPSLGGLHRAAERTPTFRSSIDSCLGGGRMLTERHLSPLSVVAKGSKSCPRVSRGEQEMGALKKLHETVMKYPKLEYMQRIIVQQENELGSLKSTHFGGNALGQQPSLGYSGGYAKEEFVEAFENRLNCKNETIKELEESKAKSLEVQESLLQRISVLEEYLKDVPTPEEYRLQKTDLEASKLECGRLKKVANERDQEMSSVRVLLEDAQSKIHQLTVQNQELTSKIQDYETLEESLESKTLHLQEKLTRIQNECDQKEKEIFSLVEEKTARELALSETQAKEKLLFNKQENLGNRILELENQLKDANENIQHVMEKNHQVEEENRKLEQALVQQKDTKSFLWKNFSRCVEDFKSTIRLAKTIAEGQDPNMSMLLGISSELNESCVEGGQMGGEKEEEVQRRQICELQRDIDYLRNLLSDQYADSLGVDACRQQ